MDSESHKLYVKIIIWQTYFCLSQSLFRLIIHLSLYVSHFKICNIDNRWGDRHKSSIKRKIDKKKYSILNLWMWTERTWVLLKSNNKPFHIPYLIRDLSSVLSHSSWWQRCAQCWLWQSTCSLPSGVNMCSCTHKLTWQILSVMERLIHS